MQCSCLCLRPDEAVRRERLRAERTLLSPRTFRVLAAPLVEQSYRRRQLPCDSHLACRPLSSSFALPTRSTAADPTSTSSTSRAARSSSSGTAQLHLQQPPHPAHHERRPVPSLGTPGAPSLPPSRPPSSSSCSLIFSPRAQSLFEAKAVKGACRYPLTSLPGYRRSPSGPLARLEELTFASPRRPLVRADRAEGGARRGVGRCALLRAGARLSTHETLTHPWSWSFRTLPSR